MDVCGVPEFHVHNKGIVSFEKYNDMKKIMNSEFESFFCYFCQTCHTKQ